MNIHILSLFPELFESFVSTSIMASAIERELISLEIHNFRHFSTNKHGNVDDKPYGGGAGMVLMCDPIFRAVEHITACDTHREYPLIMLTPQGEPLTQRIVEELSCEKGLIMMAGRYEGFDERIRIGLKPREISLGDYVLMGGELPAMVMTEAIARLIPGVLGKDESAEDESFSSATNILEYPHYTRPPVYRGMEVPEVLRGGNHKAIEVWRAEQAHANTAKNRPDLLVHTPGNLH
jgi:tRNA (guanine37-N1)-methyltransferase